MSAALINQLKEQRAGLIDRMREVTLAAESDERDLTAEETQEFDRLEQDAGRLEQRAARIEKLTGFGSEPVREMSPESTPSEREEQPEERKAPATLQEYREQRGGIRAQDTDEYRQAFYHCLSEPDPRNIDHNEYRVLSKATAGAGLNLVPTEFARTLIDALREFGIMRQVSTVDTTDSGEAIQYASVTAHGTAAWTAENAAYVASDETFGQATLNAYKAATLIKVSEELLKDSAFDLEAHIRTEFGQRIGILENTAYLVGDGSGKPTGVATQASAGVTFATNAAITADELIDLYHALLSPYRRNAVWIVRDSTMKVLRKLKDTTNQFIWQPGLVAGAPDVLLGRPIYTDPDMAAVATTAVSVLFGDFSYYKIRDVNGIMFQRLVELYAENGQVGFRANHRTDGKLLNTAAVKKGTHAV